MTDDFKKTLAAARKGSECQWELALALIDECGRPGPNGQHSGSDAKLKKAQEVLEQNGFDYSFDHLRDIRKVGALFHNDAGERSPAFDPDLPFFVHARAGDPDTLADAKKWAKGRGKKLTVREVTKFKKQRQAKMKDRERDRNADKPKPGKGVAMAELSKVIDVIREQSVHFGEYLADHLKELGPEERNKLADATEAQAAALAEYIVTLREKDADHDAKPADRQRRVHRGEEEAARQASL